MYSYHTAKAHYSVSDIFHRVISSWVKKLQKANPSGLKGLTQTVLQDHTEIKYCIKLWFKSGNIWLQSTLTRIRIWCQIPALDCFPHLLKWAFSHNSQSMEAAFLSLQLYDQDRIEIIHLFASLPLKVNLRIKSVMYPCMSRPKQLLSQLLVQQFQ